MRISQRAIQFAAHKASQKRETISFKTEDIQFVDSLPQELHSLKSTDDPHRSEVSSLVSHRESLADHTDDNGSHQHSERELTEEEIAQQEEERLQQLKNNKVLGKVAEMFSKLKSENAFPEAGPRSLRMRETIDMSKFEKPPLEEYGLDVGKLRIWSTVKERKLLAEEASKQEVALLKVRNFMAAVSSLIKLQAWWRMWHWKLKFLAYKAERVRTKNLFFSAWKRHIKAEKSFFNVVVGKPFRAWAQEAEETKRLQGLVKTFYLTCIKRLKLTPQAVMAFFSPLKMGANFSEADRAKIRRLILKKLLSGWRTEVRVQKGFRYKASAILSRMVRKTKGPMWSKEMTLLYFHMWKRYIGVRLAFKRDEPDPVYKVPYIHQWTVYLAELTMTRIYKRRALENAKFLIQKRIFRRWMTAMNADRSKPKDPLVVARLYYRQRFCRNLLRGWYGLLRGRGRIVRLQEKIFKTWGKWAPRTRKLRHLEEKTREAHRERRLVEVFDTMTSLCKISIGRRAKTLKLLASSMRDRKVNLCAYGMMNLNVNVIMIDCWRRWSKWAKNRSRYKSFLWQFRYNYYESRASTIFAAWKEWISFRKERRKSSSYRSLKGGILGNDEENDAIDREYMRSKRLHATNSFNFSFSNKIGFSESIDPFDTMVRTNSTLTRGATVESDEAEVVEPMTAVVYPTIFPNIAVTCAEIFNRCRSEAKPLSAHSGAFRMACQAMYKGYLEALISIPEDGEEEELQDGQAKDDPLKPLQSMNDVTQALQHVQVEKGSSSAKQPELEHRKVSRVNKALQDKLQSAVTELNMEAAASLIVEGARVNPGHIQFVSQFVGDEHIPLFCLLLGSSSVYLTERMIRRDRFDCIMKCANPLNAVLLSSHIDRWERCDLTNRELTSIVEGEGFDVTRPVGGRFQTMLIWRLVVLALLRVRAQEIAFRCKTLPESRSVDEEVVEVMKRQKISRLISIRESLRFFLGIEADLEPELIIPQLITSEPLPGKNFVHTAKFRDSHGLQNTHLNIYDLLYQHTQITGRLTTQARALRLPMLERDQRLFQNGFLRQARADFLQLRKMCQTEKQLKEEEERQANMLRISQRAEARAAEKRRQEMNQQQQQMKLQEQQKNEDLNEANGSEPPSSSKKKLTSKRKLSSASPSSKLSPGGGGGQFSHPPSASSRRKSTVAFGASVRLDRIGEADSEDSTRDNTPRTGKKGNPLWAISTRRGLLKNLSSKAKESAAESKLKSFLYDGEQFKIQAQKSKLLLVDGEPVPIVEGDELPMVDDEMGIALAEHATIARMKEMQLRENNSDHINAFIKYAVASNVVEGQSTDDDGSISVTYDEANNVIVAKEDEVSVVSSLALGEEAEGEMQQIFQSREQSFTDAHLVSLDPNGTDPFTYRAQHFHNLLLESCRMKVKRELPEARAILASRLCADAQLLTSFRIPQFLFAGGMGKPSKPTEKYPGGLGGWILSQGLKDIAFIGARVFVDFIPPEWWKVPLLYSRSDNEQAIVNTMVLTATLRMNTLAKKDEEITESKKHLQRFLKDTRKLFLAISARRHIKSCEDKGQLNALQRVVAKTNKHLQIARQAFQDYSDQLKLAQLKLASGNVAGVFELFGEDPGNSEIVDDGRIVARAMALLDRKNGDLGTFQTAIQEEESKLRKKETDLRNFEKLAIKTTSMMRIYAETKFNLLMDVQQLMNTTNPEQDRLCLENSQEIARLEKTRLYQSRLLSLNRKLRQKGEVMLHEIESIKGLGEKEDVYDLIYMFQRQQLADTNRQIGLDADGQPIVQPTYDNFRNVVASQESMYDKIFGSMESDGESGREGVPRDEDSIHTLESEAYAHSLQQFGPPSTTAPAPMTSEDKSVASARSILTGEPPMEQESDSLTTSRSTAYDQNPAMDTARIHEELSHRMSLTETTGKSRRAKLKAMEEHLKQIEEKMALEQERHDLRLRTFDEYWLCLGPVKEKKKVKTPKQAKSSNDSVAALSVKSLTAPKSPGMGTDPAQLVGNARQVGSISEKLSALRSPLASLAQNSILSVESSLSAPKDVVEIVGLTKLMWRAIGRQHSRNRRNRLARNSLTADDNDWESDSDDALYDDSDKEEPSRPVSRKPVSPKPIVPPLVPDGAMNLEKTLSVWSNKGPSRSVSMDKGEHANFGCFDDLEQGDPNTATARNTLQSGAVRRLAFTKQIQDPFVSIGAGELHHLRAAREIRAELGYMSEASDDGMAAAVKEPTVRRKSVQVSGVPIPVTPPQGKRSSRRQPSVPQTSLLQSTISEHEEGEGEEEDDDGSAGDQSLTDESSVDSNMGYFGATAAPPARQSVTHRDNMAGGPIRTRDRSDGATPDVSRVGTPGQSRPTTREADRTADGRSGSAGSVGGSLESVGSGTKRQTKVVRFGSPSQPSTPELPHRNVDEAKDSKEASLTSHSIELLPSKIVSTKSEDDEEEEDEKEFDERFRRALHLRRASVARLTDESHGEFSPSKEALKSPSREKSAASKRREAFGDALTEGATEDQANRIPGPVSLVRVVQQSPGLANEVEVTTAVLDATPEKKRAESPPSSDKKHHQSAGEISGHAAARATAAENEAQTEDAVEGVAVLLSGQWRVRPDPASQSLTGTTIPTSAASKGMKGRFFKDKFAAAKGIVNPYIVPSPSYNDYIDSEGLVDAFPIVAPPHRELGQDVEWRIRPAFSQQNKDSSVSQQKEGTPAAPLSDEKNQRLGERLGLQIDEGSSLELQESGMEASLVSMVENELSQDDQGSAAKKTTALKKPKQKGSVITSHMHRATEMASAMDHRSSTHVSFVEPSGRSRSISVDSYGQDAVRNSRKSPPDGVANAIRMSGRTNSKVGSRSPDGLSTPKLDDEADEIDGVVGAEDMPSPHQHHADEFIANLKTDLHIPRVSSKTHHPHSHGKLSFSSSHGPARFDRQQVTLSFPFHPSTPPEQGGTNDKPAASEADPPTIANVLLEADEEAEIEQDEAKTPPPDQNPSKKSTNSKPTQSSDGGSGEDDGSVVSSSSNVTKTSDVVGYVDAIGFHSGDVGVEKSEKARASLATVDALGNLLPGGGGGAEEQKSLRRRSPGVVTSLDNPSFQPQNLLYAQHDMMGSGYFQNRQHPAGSSGGSFVERRSLHSPEQHVDFGAGLVGASSGKRARSVSVGDDGLAKLVQTIPKSEATAVKFDPKGNWKSIPSEFCNDPANRIPTPMLEKLSDVVRRTVEERTSPKKVTIPFQFEVTNRGATVNILADTQKVKTLGSLQTAAKLRYSSQFDERGVLKPKVAAPPLDIAPTVLSIPATGRKSPREWETFVEEQQVPFDAVKEFENSRKRDAELKEKQTRDKLRREAELASTIVAGRAYEIPSAASIDASIPDMPTNGADAENSGLNRRRSTSFASFIASKEQIILELQQQVLGSVPRTPASQSRSLSREMNKYARPPELSEDAARQAMSEAVNRVFYNEDSDALKLAYGAVLNLQQDGRAASVGLCDKIPGGLQGFGSEASSSNNVGIDASSYLAMVNATRVPSLRPIHPDYAQEEADNSVIGDTLDARKSVATPDDLDIGSNVSSAVDGSKSSSRKYLTRDQFRKRDSQASPTLSPVIHEEKAPGVVPSYMAQDNSVDKELARDIVSEDCVYHEGVEEDIEEELKAFLNAEKTKELLRGHHSTNQSHQRKAITPFNPPAHGSAFKDAEKVFPNIPASVPVAELNANRADKVKKQREKQLTGMLLVSDFKPEVVDAKKGIGRKVQGSSAVVIHKSQSTSAISSKPRTPMTDEMDFGDKLAVQGVRPRVPPSPADLTRFQDLIDRQEQIDAKLRQSKSLPKIAGAQSKRKTASGKLPSSGGSSLVISLTSPTAQDGDPAAVDISQEIANNKSAKNKSKKDSNATPNEASSTPLPSISKGATKPNAQQKKTSKVVNDNLQLSSQPGTPSERL